jgi:PKD repeat protein
VDAGPDQTVDEGDLVQFNGTFNDPGRNAELGSPNADATLSWDFGDGKTAKGTLTPDHAYADDGVYTVTLTVTDQYSEIGQDILLVTVENVAPALADIPDMETMVHESVSLAISFTDPGVLDTHTVLIEWGDETSTTRNLGAKVSELTSNHTYRIPGIYTVTVTVTDKDGEEDTATLQITVNAYQAYLPFIGRP